MNDNQQIPSAIKDYAEANGLSIDHQLILIFKRYNTNLKFAIFGIGVFLVAPIGALIGNVGALIIGCAGSMLLSVLLFYMPWMAYVSSRFLYYQKNWFPINTEGSTVSLNYDTIQKRQAKHFEYILISWGVCLAIIALGVSLSYYQPKMGMVAFAAFPIYLFLMSYLIYKSYISWKDQKTLMHLPVE